MMRLALAAPALLACSILCPGAMAQWAVAGGVEYLSWTEATSPIEVTERGPLLALEVGWTQPRSEGALFAFHGKLYGGYVSYNGAALDAQDVPLSGTTGYAGTTVEAQFRYRFAHADSSWLDLVSALGVDIWGRRLTESQSETYAVTYAHLGVERRSPLKGSLIVAATLVFPISIRENAHFDALGYDQNPLLTPGPQLGATAEFGYRLQPRLALLGYVNSFHFKESNTVDLSVDSNWSGTSVQPASTMFIVGIKLEYGF